MNAKIVVDKFGGSVLRTPADIAAAVEVVAAQRRAGIRPVVVVSAFEGVTDTILSAAAVLLPDGGRSLREPRHDPSSALARETDRALATGEALSAALFALGLQAAGIPAPAAVQGQSFLGRLTRQDDAPREDFFFEMTWHDRYNPHRGIRTRRQKYIRNFGSLPLVFLPGDISRSPSGEVVREAYSAEERPAEELYDLERDPLERHNLAVDATCVGMLEELRARVTRWMEETDDLLLRGPVEQPAGPQRAG
jgi:hypothetical protein